MKGTLQVILFQGVVYGLQVGFVLLAARILGPASQGLYAVIRTSAYLIESIMWFGLTSGIIYFVAKDFEKYHDLLLNITLPFISVMFLLALLVVEPLSQYFGYPAKIGYLVLFWIVTLALLQLFQKIFLGQRRYVLYNYVSIVNSLALFCIFFISYYVYGPVTLDSILLCHVLSNSIGILCAVFFHKQHLIHFRFSLRIKLDDIKELYGVGLKGYFSGVAFLMLYRLDFFFVGYYLGSSILGIYTVSVFIVESLQKVPDWLALILGPKVASGLDDSGKLTKRYALLSLTFVVFIGLILYMLSAVHFDYVVFVVGEKYKGVEGIAMLLLPKAFLHAVMVIYAANLSGKGYTFYHPLAGLVSIAVLVIIDGLFIRHYGLNLAIIGITVAYCFATMIMIFGYKKYALQNNEINPWLVSSAN